MAICGCLTWPCPNCTPQPPLARTFPPFAPTTTWGPCAGSGHDYVIGDGKAVCNRCERVIDFDDVEPA